ncbi:hypothetical protein C8F01DRAFT_1134833 [Mycena amicta]|nr:hypothetical protein C8F01DRAFT_1134833 [Mycena amicta]
MFHPHPPFSVARPAASDLSPARTVRRAMHPAIHTCRAVPAPPHPRAQRAASFPSRTLPAPVRSSCERCASLVHVWVRLEDQMRSQWLLQCIVPWCGRYHTFDGLTVDVRATKHTEQAERYGEKWVGNRVRTEMHSLADVLPLRISAPLRSPFKLTSPASWTPSSNCSSSYPVSVQNSPSHATLELHSSPAELPRPKVAIHIPEWSPWPSLPPQPASVPLPSVSEILPAAFTNFLNHHKQPQTPVRTPSPLSCETETLPNVRTPTGNNYPSRAVSRLPMRSSTPRIQRNLDTSSSTTAPFPLVPAVELTADADCASALLMLRAASTSSNIMDSSDADICVPEENNTPSPPNASVIPPCILPPLHERVLLRRRPHMDIELSVDDEYALEEDCARDEEREDVCWDVVRRG